LTVVLALAVVLGVATEVRAQGRKEQDDRMRTGVYDALVQGVALYNGGDPAGCYRVFEGALLVLAPQLDHRPALQDVVKKGVEAARKQNAPADRAFALRKVLDQVYAELKQAGGTKTVEPKQQKLWDRLGGEPAVRAVVKDLMARAAKNPKVNFDRGGTFKPDAKALEALEQKLVELVSAVSGGPLKYTGKDMKAAHAGMGITNAEFDALAADLVATLKKFKVPQKETDELIFIIASTRSDIVEKKKGGETKKKASLYDRLGGEKAIAAVVDELFKRALANPKVNFTRKGTPGEWKPTTENVAKAKKGLVTLLGMVTGGPQKYEGPEMKAAHMGMQITDAEFDALAADLAATLKQFNVPAAEQQELMALLAATRKDIVEKQKK
jgi:hemoglobin